MNFWSLCCFNSSYFFQFYHPESKENLALQSALAACKLLFHGTKFDWHKKVSELQNWKWMRSIFWTLTDDIKTYIDTRPKGIVSITNVYGVAHTSGRMHQNRFWQRTPVCPVCRAAGHNACWRALVFFLSHQANRQAFLEILFFASSLFLNGIEWDPNFILKRYRKKFSRGKFA